MRLFEIATPTLYLCTSNKQVVGSTILPDEAANILGPELENILEAERPSGSLSRHSSIFLVTRPVGADFTYVVETHGRLERQHVGWLKMLTEADPMQEGVQRHCAQGYWSGKECLEERRESWVYRAETVRVVSRMGRCSRDAS